MLSQRANASKMLGFKIQSGDRRHFYGLRLLIERCHEQEHSRHDIGYHTSCVAVLFLATVPTVIDIAIINIIDSNNIVDHCRHPHHTRHQIHCFRRRRCDLAFSTSEGLQGFMAFRLPW